MTATTAMRLGFLPYTAILVLLLTTSAVGCLAFFGPYTGDSGRYLRLAANLADGNGLSAATQPPYDPEVFRPPMYPLFLAGLKSLGLDVYGIILVQVILYLVAINFAMRTTVAVTGNQLAAGLLGFLMAAHPALMRWTVSITTEVLCTTLFCLVAWCVAKDLRQPTWSNTIVLGICIVTLFLTRSTYVILAPVVIGTSAIANRNRGSLRYVGVLAMIILVPAVLWIGRNRSVMPSEFHPFGVGAGMALWGRAIELKEPDQKQRTALLAANREYVIAHEGTNPALQSKADADLFRAASEVIRSRWIEFVRLTVFLIVFREWSETYDPKLPTPVLWLVTVGSSALLGLGYVGIALMRTRWTLTVPLVVLCFGVAAVHAPFATEARYTAPVRPILYMFSALTVAWMLNVRTYGRRGAGRRDAALSQ